jgi:tetrahydromethanopterin S-methyltransferase subunit G
LSLDVTLQIKTQVPCSNSCWIAVFHLNQEGFWRRLSRREFNEIMERFDSSEWKKSRVGGELVRWRRGMKGLGFIYLHLIRLILYLLHETDMKYIVWE